MARFRNSNRRAAEDMTTTAARHPRQAPAPAREPGYFQRIGFDAAMI